MLFIVLSIMQYSCNSSYTKTDNNQDKLLTPTLQDVQDTNLNRVDKNGLKQGLWLEREGRDEVYYRNGKKHGVCRFYTKKGGVLVSFGEYENDTPVGTWYYFDENGFLSMKEKILGENKDAKVKNGAGEWKILPFKSQITLYYKNGQAKQFGIALYDQSPEAGFYMFGEWIFFDSQGAFIKKDTFSDGMYY